MNNALTKDEARRFAARWLPAWTGNDPERLAAFYSEDCLYLDPSSGGRLEGKPALLAYLRKLLARNPHWVWTHDDSVPAEDGFLNYWTVSSPIGDRTIVCTGVCLVQLRDGLIYRNEVFFDPTPMFQAIEAAKSAARPIHGE